MTNRRRHVSARPGFALLLSLFALLLIGAATIAGHFVAAQQFRAGHAVGASAAALYAAEAGLNLALVRWDAGVVTGLAPGSSVPLTAGALETGDRFEAFVTKLGEDPTGSSAYYLVSSVGRARRYPGARRQVGLLVRGNRPLANWAWLEIFK